MGWRPATCPHRNRCAGFRGALALLLDSPLWLVKLVRTQHGPVYLAQADLIARFGWGGALDGPAAHLDQCICASSRTRHDFLLACDREQSVRQAEEQRVGEQGIAGQPDQAGKQEIDCRVRLDARIPLIEIGRRPLERAAPAEAGDQIGLRQIHRPVLGRHQFHQPERTIQQQRQRHESQRSGCDAGDVAGRAGRGSHRHIIPL